MKIHEAIMVAGIAIAAMPATLIFVATFCPG
jgi:hypothetical protein